MGVEVAIAVGIGAAIGAIGGATVGGGGDAIWKGALVGAVSGAVTGGVGSWAGAGAGGWAGAAGGALAGGAGGVTGGLLNAALNGGTGSDYLKGGLFGGLGGAALGAAGGALGGGEGTINGELPAGAETTPLDMSTATSVEGPTIPIQETTGGLAGGNINAAATVDPTLAAPTQSYTAPALSDMYAAAPTNTVTDIGGSSAIPQELPGGVPLDSGSTYTGSGLKMPQGSSFNLDSGFDIPDQTGLQSTGQVGISAPESASTYTPTTPEGTQAMAGMPSYESPGSYDVSKSLYKTPEPNMWDKISKGFSMDGDLGKLLKMQGYGQLASGLMKTAGAVATAPETARNRQQLMDLYNTQMGQLNTQANAANKYQQNLQATYDNPEAYLSSPEAAAARSAAMQKLLAQNAAAGRRTAGLSMQNQLMMNQLSNLANYRRGLQGNIQYPNYSPAATTLNYAQQYSPTADIMGGLASGVTPLSLYSLFA